MRRHPGQGEGYGVWVMLFGSPLLLLQAPAHPTHAGWAHLSLSDSPPILLPPPPTRSSAAPCTPALGFERYKFVVETTIGEFTGQGVRVASRAVWDTTTDSYASASFKNVSVGGGRAFC